MKGFYRLLNYEFSRMFPAAVLTSLGAALCPLLFIYIAVKDYNKYSVHERFETVYASSGAFYIFLIMLLILCGLFVKNIYTAYMGSKSIYTFLMLPVRREAYYWSKWTALLICLLMLLAATLLGVFAGYGIYAAKVGSYEEGRFLMNNGLFLAFVRSELLRLLFPIGISGLISTASMGLAFISGLYYGVLCERSKRYPHFMLLIVLVLLKVYVLSERLDDRPGELSVMELYVTSGMFFVLSVIFIWHGIRLVKRGSIA